MTRRQSCIAFGDADADADFYRMAEMLVYLILRGNLTLQVASAKRKRLGCYNWVWHYGMHEVMFVFAKCSPMVKLIGDRYRLGLECVSQRLRTMPVFVSVAMLKPIE
jgi:hypothetical protein